ncbi:MAG: spore coat protein CotH [Ignavibacterium sp.]
MFKKLKYIIINFFLIFILFVNSCDNIFDNYYDYEDLGVDVIDCFIEQDNLELLRENRFNDTRVGAKIQYKNEIYNITIEAQGAGSRFYPKWSYKLRLVDDDKTIDGLQDFNLSSKMDDLTMMRTYLTSELYKELNFPIFDSKFIFFRINGRDEGLYIMTEIIDEDFFIKRSLSVNELIKAEFGSKFTFVEDNDVYRNFSKEIPDDENLNNIIEFIYALDTTKNENIFEGLNKYLNIDNYLKYHALNVILNNIDGFTNNIYFYKKNSDSPYEIIPWDFDKTFYLQLNIGIYDNNDIIKKLIQNDSCLTLYNYYLIDYINNLVVEDKIYSQINYLSKIISKAYNKDPLLGKEEISLSVETNKLKEFITKRKKFILSNIHN